MNKKKKGKNFVDIIENRVYSRIIFDLANNEKYVSEIANSLHCDTGNLSRQLKLLKEEGFVNSKIKKNTSKFPMERKTIYFLNFDKIISEFSNFLKEKVKKRLNSFKMRSDFETLKYLWGDNFYNLDNFNKLIQKEYFRRFLLRCFKDYSSFNETTLKEFFELMTLNIALFQDSKEFGKMQYDADLETIIFILYLVYSPINFKPKEIILEELKGS